MKKILAVSLVLVIFAAILCAGCVADSGSGSSTDPVVGTWQWKSEEGDLYDLVYTFNADRTFTETWYTAGTKTVEMSYNGIWNVSDGVYKIVYSNGDDVIEGANEFTLSNDGKILTDGVEIDYYRK